MTMVILGALGGFALFFFMCWLGWRLAFALINHGTKHSNKLLK